MALQDILKHLDPQKLRLKVLTEDELQSVQDTLAMMMNDFDHICKKYNIEWCLFGGSVIGAVRHNGFIPWDDDVDIFMTRSNYEAFKKIAKKELGDKYILKEPGRKNYIYHFPQLQLRNTEIESIQTTDGANDGLYIDIFIMENTFDNKVLRFLHGALCTFVLFIDSSIRMDYCKNHILKYAGNDKETVRAIKKRAVFAKLFSFFSFERWLGLSDKWFSLSRNNQSKFVSCPSGRLHYFKETYLRTMMCEYTKHRFEKYYWNIPKGYEYYLRKRYGENYMQIPPKTKQEKHIYVKLNLNGNSKGDIQ